MSSALEVRFTISVEPIDLDRKVQERVVAPELAAADSESLN